MSSRFMTLSEARQYIREKYGKDISKQRLNYWVHHGLEIGGAPEQKLPTEIRRNRIGTTEAQLNHYIRRIYAKRLRWS